MLWVWQGLSVLLYVCSRYRLWYFVCIECQLLICVSMHSCDGLCVCTDAFIKIIDWWYACGGHEVCCICVEMVCHGVYVCGGCGKGGRVVEVCSVGRVCGDVIQYVYAASGRGEVHHDVC